MPISEIRPRSSTRARSASDVDRLVLTHFHQDHTGAAAEVAEWGKVEILAGAPDAPIIRGDAPAPPPVYRSDAERELAAKVTTGLPKAPPCRVDRELTDGVVLIEPRVLFTGDTIACDQGRILLGPFNTDTERAVESFRLLAGFDADIACFGHGVMI